MKTPETLKLETIDANMDGLALDKDSSRDYWILVLLRGISMVAFGFVAIIWPHITVLALAYVFCIYILTLGMIDIINGFRMLNSKSLWFLKVLLGVAEIAVALYLLDRGLVLTALVLVQTIGLLMLLQAVVETIYAFRSTNGGLRALTIFSAFLSFVIGVALLRQPISTSLTFTWLLGFYGVVGGSIIIASALSIRPSKA